MSNYFHEAEKMTVADNAVTESWTTNTLSTVHLTLNLWPGNICYIL